MTFPSLINCLTKLLIVCPLLASVSATAKTYYENDFRFGFPSMKLENLNGITAVENLYKHGWSESGWCIERVGAQGFCAVCATHSREEEPMAIRMTTPTMTVTSQLAIVRWQALSLLAGFKEGYRVVVIDVSDGSKEHVLFETNDESHTWITRTVSLADFQGHDVKVALECTSTNGYLLAIDNLFIGSPTELMMNIEDTTPAYVGLKQNVSVCGNITNVGKRQDFNALMLVVDDVVKDRLELTGIWETGKKIKYDLHFTSMDLNSDVKYIIAGENKDGTHTELHSGNIHVNSYAATPLMDGILSLQNGDSPRFIILEDKYRELYRNDFAIVNTYTDLPISNISQYLELFLNRSVPWITIDHNADYSSNVESKFKGGLIPKEVTASVQCVSSNYTPQSRTLQCNIDVTMSKATDNSDGRYKLGYIITTSIFDPDDETFIQYNSQASYTQVQYYFLPDIIPSDLNYLTNVHVAGESEFANNDSKLPTSFRASQSYPVTCEVTLPQIVRDCDNTQVIAYLHDTQENLILNATKILISEINGSGIEDLTASYQPNKTENIVVGHDNNSLIINTREPQEIHIQIFALDGRCVRDVTEYCSGQLALTDIMSGLKGTLIVKAATTDDVTTAKILLR